MVFNKVDKLIAISIIFFIVFGFASTAMADAFPSNDQQAWIDQNSSSLGITYLQATIHITIKNNNDHAEFFKISQQYTADTALNDTMEWSILSTDPPAIKMAKNVNPGGDLGWEIDSGQTRTVAFTLVETKTPFFITQQNPINNSFWPVINEPGLAASWFLPNELDYLNPNLQVVQWTGHFFFILKNFQSTGPRVEGNVRAPIVPINSVLTQSDPTVDWISNENPAAQTAAWDITLFPGQSKSYSYTYQYPNGTSVTPANRQSASTRINSDEGSSSDPSTDPASIPTKSTGVPVGLFIVGGLVVASGIAFARYLR